MFWGIKREESLLEDPQRGEKSSVLMLKMSFGGFW